MDIKSYLASRGDLLKQRNLFALFSFMMLLICLLLSILVFVKEEIVVIVPPQIEKPFEQRGNLVSPAGVEQLSLFVSHLLFDVNPENVNPNFTMVLDQYVSARGQDYMKNWFARERDRIVDERISVLFQPQNIEIKGLNAKLEGKFQRSVSSEVLSDERGVIYITWEMTPLGLKIQKVQEEKL